MDKIGVGLMRHFLADPVDQGCRPALFATVSPDIMTEQIQGACIVLDRKLVDSPTRLGT